MNCEFCNKEFSSRGNLNLHQRTAKYCIIIQEKDANNLKLECEHCQMTFTRKSNLKSHILNCKEKDLSLYKGEIKNLRKRIKELEISKIQNEEKIENYEKQIQKLEEKNNDLQNQVIELAERAIDRPSHYTNTEQRTTKNIDNRVLNMVPMNFTQESILKALEENFTENHLMLGQKGVADFCLENILVNDEGKYLMKCTDPSRKTFIYMDEENNLQKDMNADKLTKMIYGPVKKVGKKIYDGIYDRYNRNYDEEDVEEIEEEVVDENKLNFATDKLVEISKLKNDNSEFVRRLVPPLTK